MTEAALEGAVQQAARPELSPQERLNELNERRDILEKQMRAVARSSRAGKEIGNQLDEIDDMIRLLEVQLEREGQQAIQQSGLAGPPPGLAPAPRGAGPLGPGQLRSSDFGL